MAINLNMKSFPKECDRLRPLAEAAFSKWAPEATLSFKRLKPGYSGAEVLKVDVRGAGPALESGQYVLKLSPPPQWDNQDDEIRAHERAIAWNPAFAEAHVPTLIRRFTTTETVAGQAMLFEIAGRSMDSFLAASGRESAQFLSICDRVVIDTLTHWSAPEPEQLARPHEILDHWLSFRLRREDAPRLHDFVETRLGKGMLAIVAKRVVVNPLAFYERARARAWAELEYVPALLHGDLHGGNLLVRRRDPSQAPYWIIDFGLSVTGPMGFDQAYLEVAQILACLGESDPAPLASALEQISQPSHERLIPPGAFWLTACLQKMRDALVRWVDVTHSRRIDVVKRQICLAQVAAGLNWANKQLSESQRMLALYYSAWAARLYLEFHEPEEWAQLDTVPSTTPAVNSPVDDALWQELWHTVGGFGPRVGRFILVAEALGDSAALRALGQIPWSAVIDLDPYSDEKGLHRHAAPVLETHRSVHTFGRSLIGTDFSRGTSWMMSAGWALKREGPTDFAKWRYENMHVIRSLVKSLEDAISPAPLFVLVLPGASLDSPMQRVSRVLTEIEETTQGRARIIVLGRRAPADTIKHQYVPLDTEGFVSRLETLFGVSAPGDVPQIPGPDDSWRPLPLDTLRALEENLEVLHSRILDEPDQQREPANGRDSFWRGHPPTWADFMDGTDIERALHKQLVAALREKLDESRNQTIVLYHTPGAGGTTAALRAAWDLHREHPTAVLRIWSRALTTRLQSFYHLAERPILLVADAADLTETAREDLYRELSQRNCRVVLLYIRRVINETDKADLCLRDPMPPEEAEVFYRAYLDLCDDPRRRQELLRITNDKTLERYRSPFFYGLITFERDFQPVERYIASHVLGLRGKVRDVLQYVALVTIYSNTGLHEGIVRRLMGVSETSQLNLVDLLNEGPARLVTVRQERLRLMHQILAEEVLAALSGGGPGDWRLDLADLSIDFIREVTSVIDPDSQSVSEMFRQLFVDRQGGGVDDAEDRKNFAPLIEEIDAINRTLGHRVLKALTEHCPNDPHFWNHLGRHQIYRTDYDIDKAEEYLEQAIRLSPDDYVHYHTHGMVLRARVRQTMRAQKNASVTELLADSQDFFRRAAERFEKTRELNPDNMYGYITHAQMILEVAARLKLASGVSNIAQMGNEVSGWLNENIAIAQRLLDDARQLYGTLDRQDSYLTTCFADLERLYGNINDVIAIWEIANARGSVDPASRRALAYAYLTRSDRSWSTMQQAELRRIVDLMEQNLGSVSLREEDYHLWFEAYKLLPEFDIDEALGRLQLWTKRFPSWRAYYYIYVLRFVLWFTGRSNEIGDMEQALDRCRSLRYGRRTASPQWLGFGPVECPLVSSNELGEWNRKKNFWSATESLRRINGMIDEHIPGPQAGHIRIDDKVPVFFVPGKDFFADKDENKPVSFCLGFSPDGPRAWEVHRGAVAGGDRIRPGGGPPAINPQIVPTPALTDERKLSRVQELRAERIKDFIADLIVAKADLGATLTLSELRLRAEAAFGIDGLLIAVGIGDLKQLLFTDNRYDLVEDGIDIFIKPKKALSVRPSVSPRERKTGTVVSLNRTRAFGFINDGSERDHHFQLAAVVREHQQKIVEGGIVEFISETGENGPIAVGVRQIRIPEERCGDDLRREAELFVLQVLQEAPKQELSLKMLSKRLVREFPGSSLPIRLGVPKISNFLNGIKGVVVEGAFPDVVVRLIDKEQRAFGRLPSVIPRIPKEIRSGSQQRRDGTQTIREPRRSQDEVAAQPVVPTSELKAIRPEDRVAAQPAQNRSQEAARLRAKVTALVYGILEAAGDTPLPVLSLMQRLAEELPGEEQLIERLKHQDPGPFFAGMPEILLQGTGSAQTVRLHPAGRIHLVKATPPLKPKDVAPKQRPVSGGRGAKHEQSSAADLRTKVVATACRLVDEAGGGPLLTVPLIKRLTVEFPGVGTLVHRLGYQTLAQFLDDIPQFQQAGSGPGRTVSLITAAVFEGRSAHPTEATPAGAMEARPGYDKAELRAQVRAAAIRVLDATPGGRMVATMLGDRLTAAFPGEGRLVLRMGYKNLSQFVQSIAELELEGTGAELTVRRRSVATKS